MGDEQHRLHLQVLGQEREVVLPAPDGSARATALLPAARAVVHAAVEVGVEQALAAGKSITCGPRCAACCRQLVPVSLVEATALAAAVAALPSAERKHKRKRFAEAVRRMERAGLIDRDGAAPRLAVTSDAGGTQHERWLRVNHAYFAAQIACPILEDERCSMYADRPLVCREYNVTSPREQCSSLGSDIESLPRTTHMNEVLAGVAGELDGTPTVVIPLPLALEWAAARPTAFSQEHDVEHMLERMLVHMAEVDEGNV